MSNQAQASESTAAKVLPNTGSATVIDSVTGEPHFTNSVAGPNGVGSGTNVGTKGMKGYDDAHGPPGKFQNPTTGTGIGGGNDHGHHHDHGHTHHHHHQQQQQQQNPTAQYGSNSAASDYLKSTPSGPVGPGGSNAGIGSQYDNDNTATGATTQIGSHEGLRSAVKQGDHMEAMRDDTVPERQQAATAPGTGSVAVDDNQHEKLSTTEKIKHVFKS